MQWSRWLPLLHLLFWVSVMICTSDVRQASAQFTVVPVNMLRLRNKDEIRAECELISFMGNQIIRSIVENLWSMSPRHATQKQNLMTRHSLMLDFLLNVGFFQSTVGWLVRSTSARRMSFLRYMSCIGLSFVRGCFVHMCARRLFRDFRTAAMDRLWG